MDQEFLLVLTWVMFALVPLSPWPLKSPARTAGKLALLGLGSLLAIALGVGVAQVLVRVLFGAA